MSTWGHSIEPTARRTKKCKQKGCFKRHECLVRFRIGREGNFEERIIRFCWKHGREYLAGQLRRAVEGAETALETPSGGQQSY
jgi:hypothetical protein